MKTLTLFAITLLSATTAFAATHDGVEMPDQTMVAGKQLVLNGQGTRKATIFKVKVYVAGLYLEAKTNAADAILASKQTKRLDMHFVHDVDKEKLGKAFLEGKEKNCKAGCEALAPAYDKLVSYMSDVKPGDSMAFTFLADKVEVEVKGQKLPAIDGAQFSSTFLMTWLGPNPPNEELKEGLLGQLH